MNTKQVVKGRTEKVVTIENVEGGISKPEIFRHALLSAGETTMSIFGYNMKTVTDEEGKTLFVVSLYTD